MWKKKKKKGKPTPPVSVSPLGIRNGWGRVWRDWKGEQVKEKSRRVLLCLPPPCPSLLPPPHPCITSPRGVEQLLLMGGQVFSLFFLSASGCTTDSHYPGDLLPPRTLSAFRTHGKHKHTYEHTSAAQHLNPLHSLLPLIFLCGALCSRRAWARWGELGRTKRREERKKRRMEKRGLRWWWWRKWWREGMNEREKGEGGGRS